MMLPVGLVYDPAGKVVLDPDAGVQHALRHLFSTFARTGSARAVVQTFRAEGLRFPGRIRTGPHKGELSWTPLRHDRVLRVLHNPRYAGAFVYGRLRQRPGPNGRLRVQRLPREEWTALIPDAHPGYITWETFELNQKLLAANAQAHGSDRTTGPAREGNALLQGLAICGRCGCRMSVHYHQRSGTEIPGYRCMRAAIRDGVAPCASVPGSTIDIAIGQLLLDTVTPLALEVALTVQAELETRADEADALRKSHVERARHRAETARRRYLAVDPDNRLVADTLEADWNDALRQLQTAQDDYERAATAARAAFTDEHKARIRALAADFPALWSNPATPQRERKRMARLLIEDVTINKTDQIHLHVRFKGGQTTSLAIPIPLTSWQARQTNADTLALLDRLLDDHTDAQAAKALNVAGHHSGTGQPFTPSIVLHLRRSNGLPSHLERLRSRGLLTIPELAEHLGVSTHPPSRPGTEPACSHPTKPTTRTSGSSTRPHPATPASSKRWNPASPTGFHPDHRKGVQYETIALSQHWPLRDRLCTPWWAFSRARKSVEVYCDPRSERKINPGAGRRAAMAMCMASQTSEASM